MNSVTSDQEAVASYARPGCTSPYLTGQRPARENGPPGSQQELEKPPWTPPR